MTEEEAKTKWCPMVRHYAVGEGDHSSNRMDMSTRCLGSECMAWRWLTPPGTTVQVPTSSGLYQATTSPGNGYCGMAGKP